MLITNSEEEYKLLEPWVQWVSVYTGKRPNDHKIFRLGDIKKYIKYYQQYLNNNKVNYCMIDPVQNDIENTLIIAKDELENRLL